MYDACNYSIQYCQSYNEQLAVYTQYIFMNLFINTVILQLQLGPFQKNESKHFLTNYLV